MEQVEKISVKYKIFGSCLEDFFNKMTDKEFFKKLKSLANPKNVAGSGRVAGAQKRGGAEKVEKVIF